MIIMCQIMNEIARFICSKELLKDRNLDNDVAAMTYQQGGYMTQK